MAAKKPSSKEKSKIERIKFSTSEINKFAGNEAENRAIVEKGIFCPTCLKAHLSKYCPDCGVKTVIPNICPSCHIETGNNFCSSCGHPIFREESDLVRFRLLSEPSVDLKLMMIISLMKDIKDDQIRRYAVEELFLQALSEIKSQLDIFNTSSIKAYSDVQESIRSLNSQMFSISQYYNTMVQYLPDQFKSINELLENIDTFTENNTIEDFIRILNLDKINTELAEINENVIDTYNKVNNSFHDQSSLIETSDGIQKVLEYFVKRHYPDIWISHNDKGTVISDKY